VRNSAVVVADDSSLDFHTLGDDEGFMIDFWMKEEPTANPASGLVCKRSYGNGYVVTLSHENKIRGLISKNDVNKKVYSTTVIDDYDWHHIVFVWDRATLYMYVDDMTNPDNSEYVGEFDIGNTDKWLDIGNNWPSDNLDPFNGDMDEVRISIIVSNSPPNKPSLSGDAEVDVGKSKSYSVSATDPDGDQVYYYIDWGDDTNTGWFGPYDPGTKKSKSHSWDEEGYVSIKAKSKDVHGAESGWKTLSIEVPREKHTLFEMIQGFIERILDVLPSWMFPIIRSYLGI